MRALVTGAGGFAGRHLLAALAAAGHELLATDLQPPQDGPPGVQAEALDVTDACRCREAVASHAPDVVYHLAAMAQVVEAEADPRRCLEVNLGGTRHLLEACLDARAGARFVLISSCEVYGRVAPEAIPVREDQPLRPATAYAFSKACAEMATQHAAARGLDVVILRPFNHFGPGQADAFVSAAFAHQIARIEAGLQEPVLRVGNLEAVRDFSDVRATVDAYLRAAERAPAGETYNVTAGAAVSIRTLLDTLLSLSDCEVQVQTDPSRLRPVDVPAFHGCPQKLARDVGPLPTLDLEASLRDVLAYWRARLVPAER